MCANVASQAADAAIPASGGETSLTPTEVSSHRMGRETRKISFFFMNSEEEWHNEGKGD